MAGKKTYIFCFVLFLPLCLHFTPNAVAETNTYFSEEKPDGSFVIAGFFPKSSPFSHSRISGRLSKKKIKKKNNTHNRNNYNVFLKSTKAVIEAIKKTESVFENKYSVLIFWQLGQALILEKKKQEKNKDFFKYLIKNLSSDLHIEKDRLQTIMLFYEKYTLAAEISPELNFLHYEILITVKDNKARKFYQKKAVSESLSQAELKICINQKIYEKHNNDE